MKKMRIVFPILLVCAGMVMMGCTSDPEPKRVLGEGEYDFILEGGKCQVDIVGFTIEDGKDYEVIFTIDDCDGVFLGSHLGGKICYKMDLDSTDEKVLSGWLNSSPNTVSSNITRYKWTFTAGEKNNDDVSIVSPATTPSGGNQYFSLTAQDSSWKDYKSTENFHIKGSITIQEKEAIDIDEDNFTISVVQTVAGSGTVLGVIQEDAFSSVDSAKNTTGSFLRLYVSDKSSSNIGKIGPDKGEGTYLDLNSNSAGIIDIDLEELFVVNTATYNYININIWTGTLTKVELWVPK